MRSNWRRRALLVFAVVGIVVAGGATAPAGASDGAVRVVFDKHLIDPANLVFEDAVANDLVVGIARAPIHYLIHPPRQLDLERPRWRRAAHAEVSTRYSARNWMAAWTPPSGEAAT